MWRLLVLILVFFVIDFFAIQSFKSVFKGKWLYIVYIVVSILVVGNLIYQFATFNRGATGFTFGVKLALAIFSVVYLTKLFLALFMFGEDIFRVLKSLYNLITEQKTASGSYIPSRRKFIGQLALGVASIPFAASIYGVIRGKYNYKVIKHTLTFKDLPEAFDGYQITQISDLHCGSFDNAEKIAYGVDLINQQESDLILFTGDMVSNVADEMLPWMDTFSKLKAKDGMFSVLGNHDYGDYKYWSTSDAKAKNLQKLIDQQEQLGFKVLKNESAFIEKNNQRIAIQGVENWGAGGFKKAGDLEKTVKNVDSNDFKILMSHDPSHWEAQVVDHKYHHHLTLSGHTHGMQFGIEIPGWFKWSPIKWRYKQWAGIYKQKGQYINVNRGFGFLAFPGRIGIWPEVTVITLKKGDNTVS